MSNLANEAATENHYRQLADEATTKATEAEDRANSYRNDVAGLHSEYSGIQLAITAAVHKLDLGTVESLQSRSATLALIVPHTSKVYESLAKAATALRRDADRAERNHRTFLENKSHAQAVAGNAPVFGPNSRSYQS